MSGGALWATRFASAAGGLLWGFGALLHLPSVVILVVAVNGLFPGQSGLVSGATWGDAALIFGALVIGPIVTTVGAGMRVCAGLMTGRKVAGRLFKTILRYEWLRYELIAAGFGLMGGGILSVGLGLSPLIAIAAFFGSILGGIRLFGLSWNYGRRSAELMWVVRQEAVQAGMGLPPVDAVPRRP